MNDPANRTIKDWMNAAYTAANRADKAEAEAAAYRTALEKIRAATKDPWYWNMESIAGICNEALGNGKP